MSTVIDMLDDLPSAAKRRLLLGWLPILLVIILLCIFGGIPPLSWGLTLRLMAMSSALKDVPASTVSSYLNALIIQSVCMFIAWLLIILAIIHELMAFKSIQTQVRISRLQAKLASPTSDVQAPPAPSPVAGLDPVALPTIALPAPRVLPESDVIAPALNTAPPDTSIVTPPPKRYGVQVTIDNTPDDYPANPFVSRTAEAKSTRHLQAKPSADQQVQPDPFSVQDNLLDLLDMEDKTPSEREEESAQQEELVEQEPIFVYGNPFEGDLPEVFTYDKDLQKAVEGLRNGPGSKRSPDSKGVSISKTDLDADDEDEQ
jgi:hypothetical protein